MEFAAHVFRIFFYIHLEKKRIFFHTYFKLECFINHWYTAVFLHVKDTWCLVSYKNIITLILLILGKSRAKVK